MSEPWTLAVTDADVDMPADLTAAVQGELECLWSDLDEAIRSTIRTVSNPDGAKWSIGALGIATRIIVLSRLTGATSWKQVPTDLIVDGTYQGMLTAAGISYVPPTEDDLRQWREYRDRQQERLRR